VTLRLVTRYGDTCNFGARNPQVIRRKLDVLRQHCDDLGRDFDSITKSTSICAFPTQNDTTIAAATTKARGRLDLDRFRQIATGGSTPDTQITSGQQPSSPPGSRNWLRLGSTTSWSTSPEWPTTTNPYTGSPNRSARSISCPQQHPQTRPPPDQASERPGPQGRAEAACGRVWRTLVAWDVGAATNVAVRGDGRAVMGRRDLRAERAVRRRPGSSSGPLEERSAADLEVDPRRAVGSPGEADRRGRPARQTGETSAQRCRQ
jgi:alkanesulfonate monooxygenase SsuD/methylene tetrahydromethanopterin reductase-like flavin-dependent oxidoreductase (luciferase family)